MSWPRPVLSRSVIVLPLMLALAGCGDKKVEEKPARPVRVTEVALSALNQQSHYTGTIVARTEVQAAFRTGGRIAARLVEVGEQIKAGQVLAKLDPADLTLALRAAEAQLAQAEAQAQQANADLRRYTPLLASGTVSQAQFDRVKATADAANGQLNEARSGLARARNDLSYADLTLTQAGTVTELVADAGQVVAAGQAVLRVATDLGREVVIDVPESQVTRLNVGDSATVSVWADREVNLTGKVREITPAADAATRTFRLRVALPDDQAAPLLLGMTATVRFDATAPDGMVLPPSALFQDGDKPAVWVLSQKRDRVELRPVTVAAYRADAVVIQNGLKPGELVVTAGVHRLDANLPVRVWDGGLP
ncbi:efflux RND transporter periplasmic adaptor subunit [Niveispirillum irakense]|uniref:efflux RND transporter periplasmic adaptor subunit n=1 Tax=Niveispirillum irakense TaxID=34011 RepID=UPI0004246A33|nr:efflux RND transporter periplasmic adaptor subunit [Niveispirillum irakense]